MDFNNILKILLRPVVFISIGYIINKLFKSNKSKNIIEYIIDILWYLLIPFFVVFSIWQSDISAPSSGYAAAGAIFVVIAVMLCAAILTKFTDINFRDIALPVSFMNSGYLGLALNKLIFGNEAMLTATVYNAVNALLIFTIGIYIASGSSSFKKIFKVPVVYALAAGIILNISGIEPIADGNLINIIPYMMLIFVGYNLVNISKRYFGTVAAATLIRILGGLLAATLFIYIFKPGESAGKIILLSSALPSALNTIIIAKKYDLNETVTGGIITLSTLIFMGTLPFIIKYIYYIT